MKTIHKLLALALCLALLCGAVSATMRETGTSGLKLADEVTYTHTSWSNDQKEGQYLQEHPALPAAPSQQHLVQSPSLPAAAFHPA